MPYTEGVRSDCQPTTRVGDVQHVCPLSIIQSSVPISSAAVGEKLGSKGTGRKHQRRYKRKRVRRGVKKRMGSLSKQVNFYYGH